jgi:type III secretion system (T3SS) SseB-like protein
VAEGVAVTDWTPATEAEAAMQEALVNNDQEHYFQILARTELLLPVSADAVAGRAEVGWGTWTSGNRTHVLSFTSGEALYACLAQHGGSFRTLAFPRLAAEWPNHEWWLAVNPGLPIEAYLPSWFVSQLTRGDVRLPGRTLGARARMAHSELAANGRARASAAAAAASGSPARPGDAPVTGSAATREGTAAREHATGRETAAGRDGGPGRDGALGRDGAAGRGGAAGRARVSEPVDAEIVEPRRGYQAPQQSSGSDRDRGLDRDRMAGAGLDEVSGQSAAGRPPAGRSGPGRAAGSARPSPPEGGTQLSAADAWAAGFTPANQTESHLLAAAQRNNTDEFLSTLLLARVIVPVPPGTPPTAKPSDPSFPWQVEQTDGNRYVPVFTSPERLAEHLHARAGGEIASVSLRFLNLIGAWPDAEIGFAVNPGSPVGATLPGTQIVALATWAAEVGLRDEPAGDVMVVRPGAPRESLDSTSIAGPAAAGVSVMQKTITPEQLPYYLERGYDRVSGFVHRAGEVAKLTTPRLLYHALGLSYAGSPFRDDAPEAYVLRWVGHRVDLYRIPYGGQHEPAMRAMQGWVIERPPFRGNGFAPGDSSDVIAEFKVDSVRLPHGAQIWRLTPDGAQTLVAMFHADGARWVRPEPRQASRGQGASAGWDGEGWDAPPAGAGPGGAEGVRVAGDARSAPDARTAHGARSAREVAAARDGWGSGRGA